MEKRKKRMLIDIAIIALLLAGIVSGFILITEIRKIWIEVDEYDNIQEQYITDSYEPAHETTDETITETQREHTPPARVGLPLLEVDFEALLNANSDTVGWVYLPNTLVSYPVVQTADNAKYLTTSFDGSTSRAGTPFVDRHNNMQILDANTIIYGHNMGIGRDDMFSSLLGYKDYAYFTENRYIQFDTVYQRLGWWEVFAVVEYNTKTARFPFLQINFNNEETFADWLESIKEHSTYFTDVELYTNPRILTLSTCDRSKHGRDGRVLILAVNIKQIAYG